MKHATFFLLAFALACPALRAQELRTGETTAPRQSDPLGFGALSKDRPKGSTTEITAQKEAAFNEKENQAIFIGDVKVKDPAFLLSTDRLTVFLNKDRSGIDRAVAEGNVIILQQTSNPGEKGAIGRARQAVYVPTSGLVTLSGWPEVQQGINRHIATTPNTRMIMHRDGRATTEGASKTMITDTEGAANIR
ncbi:MAG: LptA/OstA family protein [Chthoniobacterales bacterium]|jgi:lipopolysaccharide transport protein LptA